MSPKAAMPVATEEAAQEAPPTEGETTTTASSQAASPKKPPRAVLTREQQHGFQNWLARTPETKNIYRELPIAKKKSIQMEWAIDKEQAKWHLLQTMTKEDVMEADVGRSWLTKHQIAVHEGLDDNDPRLAEASVALLVLFVPRVG